MLCLHVGFQGELDLVRGVRTSSFMNCLRRFTPRNDVATIIISDNAKMLKATEKALSQLHASQGGESLLGECPIVG